MFFPQYSLLQNLFRCNWKYFRQQSSFNWNWKWWKLAAFCNHSKWYI
jgi:hypothetical protein